MYKKRHNSLAILIPSFNEKKNFKNLLFKLNKNYKIWLLMIALMMEQANF